MLSLIEKSINCYIQYINNLSYGIQPGNYEILYKSILLLKNNITDAKYIEYFNNNLVCRTTVKLVEQLTNLDVISWAVAEEDTLPESPNFLTTSAPYAGKYKITTPSVIGYNFLYITAPKHKNIRIYDEMNDLLFDSSYINNEFVYSGNVITQKGRTNAVYRKNNVFNTLNPIIYYITLY